MRKTRVLRAARRDFRWQMGAICVLEIIARVVVRVGEEWGPLLVQGHIRRRIQTLRPKRAGQNNQPSRDAVRACQLLTPHQHRHLSF
jgi:hypothetical protein